MSNAAANTPVPNILNNRYRVLQVLGDGGFGKTFLAEDTQMPSSRRVVVKQLKPITEDNPEIHQLVLERFQREAALLEQLGDSHDQIPRLYAYFAEAEQFYLVEEWVEGDTLTQKLKKEGPLKESLVRDLLTHLLPVIQFIHQRGIVHRDIKPDNIILRQRDSKPVLIDFGAVKETMGTVINSQGNSSRSIVVGTAGYMPAEQLAGRPVFASDLYSLGMTAIYLLTGKIPQELTHDPATGEVLWRGLVPMLDPAFADLLEKSIHLQPRDRFTTAQEMLTSLQNLGNTPYGAAPANAPLPATVYSAVKSGHPVRVVPPAAHRSESTQVAPVPMSVPAKGKNIFASDWLKAVILGAIIGGSILAGAVLIRQQLPTSVAEKPAEPIASPTVSPTPDPQVTEGQPDGGPPPSPVAVQPTASPPVSTPAPVPPPTSTNATITGEPGSKNIRSGPGTSYTVTGIAYPGDRVLITGSDREPNGFLWYKVYFPKSGAEGWIAGHLLTSDGQTSSVPTPTPAAVASSDTNATIIGKPGSKNIRSGPGTVYGVSHIAYPGDRVRILSSGHDSGGFLWYKVSFPKSGAEGWIAAQLIQRD